MYKYFKLGLIVGFASIASACLAAPYRAADEAVSTMEKAMRSSDYPRLMDALNRFKETVDAYDAAKAGSREKTLLGQVLSPSARASGKNLEMVINKLRADVCGGVSEEPMKLVGPVSFNAVLKVAEDQVAKTVDAIRTAGAGLSKEQKEDINTAANVNIFPLEEVRMMRRR